MSDEKDVVPDWLEDALCDALTAAHLNWYDGLRVEQHIERLIRRVREECVTPPPRLDDASRERLLRSKPSATYRARPEGERGGRVCSCGHSLGAHVDVGCLVGVGDEGFCPCVIPPPRESRWRSFLMGVGRTFSFGLLRKG